ncbi:MAG: oxidoreductase [Lysobacterales bacterium]|nr:MAG: oxidoreductase [Xanthomonadales bacterium]
MRRIRIDRPGSHRVLRLEEAPDPVPREDELLLRVHACGVNFADTLIRRGLYASARKLHGYPITPGFEVAGEVVALGAKVQGYKPGDRVVALTLFGGYSSHLCLPSDRVFPLPEGLSFAQAAAIPTVFLTAWYLVHELLHPRAGDRWLVHSAAGGVGSALCQLGRLAGCHVVGVVGAAHKREHALAMGAEVVIDRRREAWMKAARDHAPEGYQAVFDANGYTTLRQSFDLLAPGGRLVVYGFHEMLPRSGGFGFLRLIWGWLRTPRFSPLALTESNRSLLAANLSFLEHRAPLLRQGMQWVLDGFSRGLLRPLPVELYPLAEVESAHRRLESGQTIGKIVLIP